MGKKNIFPEKEKPKVEIKYDHFFDTQANKPGDAFNLFQFRSLQLLKITIDKQVFKEIVVQDVPVSPKSYDRRVDYEQLGMALQKIGLKIQHQAKYGRKGKSMQTDPETKLKKSFYYF